MPDHQPVRTIEIRNRTDASGIHPLNLEVVDAETGAQIQCIKRIELVIDAERGENSAKLYLLPSRLRLTLRTQAILIDNDPHREETPADASTLEQTQPVRQPHGDESPDPHSGFSSEEEVIPGSSFFCTKACLLTNEERRAPGGS